MRAVEAVGLRPSHTKSASSLVISYGTKQI
jgi:hypothetical protein